MKVKELKTLIKVAKGEEKGTLLLTNGRLVNIFTGEIYKSDVIISGDKIAGIGSYAIADKIIDLKGSYILPGFIESHIHIESSLLSCAEFSRLTLLSGTTTLFCDPHEIANVLGIRGIYYLLRATKPLPQDFYFLAPSCVPATKFETAGGAIGINEIKRLLKEKRIVGLAEVMNFVGVVGGESAILNKILVVRKEGKVIDGHSPGLRGNSLQAYLASGISSDHESFQALEAKEKLSSGMWIMIREGSAAKNLSALSKIINEKTSFRLLLCSDDKDPEELLREGHLNAILRKGVGLGIDPVTLIRMVTINPASYFGLNRVGAIAPGFKADITVVRDLKDFAVARVIKNGKEIVEEGEVKIPPSSYSTYLPSTRQGAFSTFKVRNLYQRRLEVGYKHRLIKVIRIVPGEIITKKELVIPKVAGNLIVSDTERDILKLVVIERHKGTGNIGIGFVSGFGLKKGAIGSSVAHDSHNIIVCGVTDEDILLVAKMIIEMRGGMVIEGGRKEASLPLPIAGLLSDKSAEEVIRRLKAMLSLAKELGCRLENPFATLSFLALPVIPELRLTDKGLFSAQEFKFVSLFGD